MQPLFVLILVFYRYYAKFTDQTEKEYKTESKQCAEAFAETLNKSLNAFYYVTPESSVLFYNLNLLVYADIIKGTVTGYDRESIKKIDFQHIRLADKVEKKVTGDPPHSEGRIEITTTMVYGMAYGNIFKICGCALYYKVIF